MSEGFPEGQDQSVPSHEELRAQIEGYLGITGEGGVLPDQTLAETPGEGEPVVHQEPDDDNGPWSLQKAQTMAAVMQETPELRGEVDWHTYEVDKAAAQAGEDAEHRINAAEAKRAELQEMANIRAVDIARDPEVAQEYADEALKRDTRVIELHANQAASIEAARQKAKEKSFEKVDRDLSRAEVVYELNPKLFAEMKTSDFMAVCKECTGLLDAYYAADGLNTDLDMVLESVTEKVDQKLPLTPEGVSADLWDLQKLLEASVERVDWAKLGIDGDKLKDATEGSAKVLVSEVFANAYDSTPRQVAEGYQAILGTLKEVAQTLVKEADDKVSAFEARYVPEEQVA
jgi:hypothetical protein